MTSSRLSIACLLMLMLAVLCIAEREQQLGNWRDPQNTGRSRISSARTQYPNRPLPRLKPVAEWFAKPTKASQRWTEKSNSSYSERVTSGISPTEAFAETVETDFCRFHPQLFKDAIQTAIRLEANVSPKVSQQLVEILIAQPFPEVKSSGDYPWGPWVLNDRFSPSTN